jgi:hypothetical protein
MGKSSFLVLAHGFSQIAYGNDPKPTELGKQFHFFGTNLEAEITGRRRSRPCVSAASVRSGFGQGRMVLAGDSVRERMADRAATMNAEHWRTRGKKVLAVPQCRHECDKWSCLAARRASP